MVTITFTCPYCASDRLIRYGVTPNGKQRYRCGTCGRQHREHPDSNAYSAAERDTTVRAMVLPGDTEPLLGVIPLQDMGVVINPRQQTLVVNPQTPYIPKKPLK